ncbi:hypothetical protein CC78DRAFT_532514 [Lojkania enalia]|uniref:Uncharacterized protein n=1 Tax=Lojkania enalia TaxID=147567 RepID=A0A9P4N477_9PLEO|nr:hypothetical protein CC78DRAFT_532514 [Didymosphaeria enalia]
MKLNFSAAKLQSTTTKLKTLSTPPTLPRIAGSVARSRSLIMSRSGVNMATTKDGAIYNKLRRPDDFFTPFAAQSPPPLVKPTLAMTPPSAESSKRKHNESDRSDSEIEDEHVSKKPKADESRKMQFDSDNEDFTANETTTGVDNEGFTPNETTTAKDNKGHILDEASTAKENENRAPRRSRTPPDNSDCFSEERRTAAQAYFDSVKLEESLLPWLFSAPPLEAEDGAVDESMYNNDHGDKGILYRDGIFIARGFDSSTHASASASESSEGLDTQEQYYRQLLKRYKNLRKSLALATPQALAERAKAHPSVLADSRLPQSKREWNDLLDNQYPTLAQMCRFGEESIFRTIGNCARSLDRLEEISKQRSCWIWALLAKVGEMGTLDYTRVGAIRILANKAGQFSIRLRNGATPQRVDDDDENEYLDSWDLEDQGAGVENMDDRIDSFEEESDRDGETNSIKGKSPTENTQSDQHPVSSNQSSTIIKPIKNADKREESKWEEADDENSNMSMSEDGKITNPSATTKLEAARARLLAQLGDRLVHPHTQPTQHIQEQEHTASIDAGTAATNRIDWNSRVTIDMILTVAAECYGQKDLLRFRHVWSEGE